MREFLKDYVQGISECIDDDEVVTQLTDEEMDKTVEMLMHSRAWDYLNEEIIQTIYEVIANRKAMIRDMKEDELKDERYQ
jgi:hypothetical protein